MAARFLTQSEMANCSTATCSDMRCLPKRKYTARKEVREVEGARSRAERRATSEIMRTAGQEIKRMELVGRSGEELRALCGEMGEPADRGGEVERAREREGVFDVVF